MLGLSHLNEHRYNLTFENCVNPLCTCSVKVKSKCFLQCHQINVIQMILLYNLEAISKDMVKLYDNSQTNVLQQCNPKPMYFGESKFYNIQNYAI